MEESNSRSGGEEETPSEDDRSQPPPPSSNRQNRNLAEKNRRDKIKEYIDVLGQLVPMVGCLPKKDKTSILRLSATFLRMHQTVSSGKELIKKSPKLPNNMNWCQVILEGMEGLLLVVTSSGKIVFISPSVDALLGHQQLDLLGQSLFSLTHPEDRKSLERELRVGRDERTTALPGPSHMANRISERRSFYLRLQKRTSKGEQPQYELVHVVGHLRIPPHAANVPSSSRVEIVSTNDIVLVALVKPFKEKRVSELSLLEANREEWISRHLVDGRIIYSDHRISYSSGYFSEEVAGFYAFNFIHKDDVRWVMIALRMMYLHGESYGCSCYRLKMKTGKFMYIRTQGYLEIGDANSVQSFICINTPVARDEGEKLIEDMKKTYKHLLLEDNEPMIAALADSHSDTQSNYSVSDTEPDTENPDQLKEFVNLLTANLEEIKAQPPKTSDEKVEKIAIVSKVLPPVSVQSTLAGVTPPLLKKSVPSPSPSAPSPGSSIVLAGPSKPVSSPAVTVLSTITVSSNETVLKVAPTTPPPLQLPQQQQSQPATQCRPSVLRLAAPPDKAKRSSEDSNQLPAAPKRPKSVIVSEPPASCPVGVITAPVSSSPLHHHPSSHSFSSSSQNIQCVIDDAKIEDRLSPTNDLFFSNEWFSLSNVPLDHSVDLQLHLQDFSDDFDNQLGVPSAEEEEALVSNLLSANLAKLEEGVSEGQIRLEGSMERQGRQIAAIENDLASVPTHHSASSLIYRSTFSHLKAEHKKQQELLKTLQQDHQSMTQQHAGSSSHQITGHNDIGV